MFTCVPGTLKNRFKNSFYITNNLYSVNPLRTTKFRHNLYGNQTLQKGTDVLNVKSNVTSKCRTCGNLMKYDVSLDNKLNINSCWTMNKPNKYHLRATNSIKCSTTTHRLNCNKKDAYKRGNVILNSFSDTSLISSSNRLKQTVNQSNNMQVLTLFNNSGFSSMPQKIRTMHIRTIYMQSSVLYCSSRKDTEMAFKRINDESEDKENISNFSSNNLSEILLSLTKKESKYIQDSSFEQVEATTRKNKLENILSSQFDTNTKRQRRDAKKKESVDESMSGTFTDKKSYEDIENEFSSPKSTLHQVYDIINAQLKQKNSLSMSYCLAKNVKHLVWVCTCKVSWPHDMTFTATASNKQTASRAAAVQCLHWLHSIGKLKNGLPIIYNSDEIRAAINKPMEINVKPELLAEMKMLLDDYETEVKDILRRSEAEISNYFHSNIDQPSVNLIHPLVGRPFNNEFFANNDIFNEDLQARLLKKKESQKINFPIAAFRQQIIDKLEQNQVLLIKGETGCGKSTQVPQFLLDHFSAQGKGTDCNVIVTEPRRISAISLAEFVARERGEEVGDVIGYQVRLKQVLPNVPGGVLYCTTGVLLRKLQKNPNLLGCSHVILDEAHERSVNIDMLMVLLKQAMQRNPSLKVVVMSATINADLFQNYFDCDAINVPGILHPVKMHFLEDIEKLGCWSSRASINQENHSMQNPLVNLEQVAQFINWICRNKPEGAILCFLPGWAEIIKVKSILEKRYLDNSQHIVVPLHSKMKFLNQRKIFDKSPPGMRKIILSTDIAETGITINDVVYVVDSAIYRSLQLDKYKDLCSLNNQWVSQANITQRKGRAGRVRPGESYHFLPKSKYLNLVSHPYPEVLRISLDKVILDCKMYSNEKAEEFLALMPQPPSVRTTRRAVANLKELGALDDRENLTALGKRISFLTIHPKLSKALVYSAIFNCVYPVTTIVSLLSYESDIFSAALSDKSFIRNVKKCFHPSSDHMALTWLYVQWELFLKENVHEAEKFILKTNLIPERMFMLQQLRNLHAKDLTQSRMLNESDKYDDMKSYRNEYAIQDQLVIAVLFAGTDKLLHRKNFYSKKCQLVENSNFAYTEDKSLATFTSESVNYKRNTWPSPYLTCFAQTHSEERRTILIRESSMLSPLTVLLFSQKAILNHECQQDENENNEGEKILFTIKYNKNVKIICDKEQAALLLRFRHVMWSVIHYLIKKQGIVFDNDMEVVELYKNQMLHILEKILRDSSKPLTAENNQEIDLLTKENNKC